MTSLPRRFWLIPVLTIFLLLTLDVVLIRHMDEIPAIYQENGTLRFPSFHARDLNGNPITEEIFHEKFSIICLWVMQDSAASGDLFRELSAWQSESPAPFQIIGIIGDLRDTDSPDRIHAAGEATKDFPQEIPQLLVNDGLNDFLRRIRNAPTICFVNAQGEFVGQPVVGNELPFIRKEAERLMEAESGQVQIEKKIQSSLFHCP